MNDRNDDDVIEFVPANGHGTTGRQAHAVEQYRLRGEIQQRAVQVPDDPKPEQGDIRTWLGGRKQSPQVQRHNALMAATRRAREHAQHVLDSGVYLEYHGFKSSLQGISAEEQELLATDGNSLAGVVGEQMFVDSAERMRQLNTDVQEHFRGKVLGS